MYIFIKIRHDIPIQGHGNHMMMKKFNYMLKINILRNSSQKKLGVLRGAFKGFGCRNRHQDALLAKTMWPTLEKSTYSDIHVDDIAILQAPVVRNPVTGYVIDWRAHGLGKALVVQRGGVRSVMNTSFVNYLVNIICRHANLKLDNTRKTFLATILEMPVQSRNS